MTDYRVWEDWPGYSSETRLMLEVAAATLREDCQGWSVVVDDCGHPVGDRVFIRGTMSQPAYELLGEVVDESQLRLLK